METTTNHRESINTGRRSTLQWLNLGETLMSLSGNATDGYTTTFAIHLPITTES